MLTSSRPFLPAATITPPSADTAAFVRLATLKSDVFSTIDRGIWSDRAGEHAAIRRDLTTARWWAKPLAWHFGVRERRSLARASGIEGIPALHAASDGIIIRGFIEGLPFQMAKPYGQVRLFSDAKRLLRQMRRAGVCHNDLAKEPNWLVTPDGRAAVTDFQLATIHNARGRLYRLLAHEDLRHLLKHKRKFCPEAITPGELRVLKKKSLPARIWLMTGKKVYKLITRDLLGVRDREGGGLRLHREAPHLEAVAATLAGASAAAIVGFPYRRKGVGLYAFVESASLTATEVVSALKASAQAEPPEMIQIVSALPRRADGAVMTDVLSLIATNQIDLLPPLVAAEPAQKAVIDAIIEGRLNVTDRARD
ncbi:MAG: serine/threonine protein kinase [Bosea sp. (in: a-proteobacteria)]